MTGNESIIAGATVTLTLSGQNPQSQQPLHTVVSDLDGLFSFVLDQPGRYSIHTNKKGYRPSTNDFVIQKGEHAKIEIILYRMEQIQGSVLDQNRSPLAKIPVHAVVKGGNNDTEEYILTDEHGTFYFMMDERQHYILDATRENSVPAVVQGIFSDSHPELILSSKGNIKGCVVDNINNAVPFSTISIRNFSLDPAGNKQYGGTLIELTSDQSGIFIYTGLVPGRYEVRAEQEDFVDMGMGSKDLQLQTPLQTIQLSRSEKVL